MRPGFRAGHLAIGLLMAAAAAGCSATHRKEAREALEKAATQQPTWQQLPSTNKPRAYVVVQFTDASLHPATARVTPGGNVAWVNYSMDYQGTVVFPHDLPKWLTCGDPGPRFGEVAAGYQSPPITGEEAEDITLPCPLKPGEYEYQLYLFQGIPGGPTGMSDPDFTMQGRIIVE